MYTSASLLHFGVLFTLLSICIKIYNTNIVVFTATEIFLQG